MTGKRKIVSNVENAIAKVLLYASGSKRRASRCSRKNTGRNDVRMISSENRRGLVTDAIDRTRISCRSTRPTEPRRESSAVQFSTMTIVASAISPMAIARPASENRLIVCLKPTSGMAVNSTANNRMAIGPRAVRKFLRNSSVTAIRTTSSIASVSKNCRSVAQIQAERSYVLTISIPPGREDRTCRSLSSIERVTASTFWACSMIATPPTTSPVPSRSTVLLRWS